MKKTLFILTLFGFFCTGLGAPDNVPAISANTGERVFTGSGLPTNDKFFPIAVWLQSPGNAASRFRSAGINLYIGLWEGPTKAQLTALEKAGMPVVCEQNQVALENKANPIIAAWMHGDEPDNAQSLGKNKGYGPPVPPADILGDYQRMRAADPSRPVILNLGQGVAWDNYIGRGVRRNHPEDYADYAKGCDVASFDIYPVVHDSPEIAGKLEFVGTGVERLAGWTGGKPVWNCIECTHIGNPAKRATPQQVRSEVWMGLIRGSRGIIYFVHQFKPVFREAALLDDPDMLKAVTAINKQITELAPVLNSPTIQDGLGFKPDGSDANIATMLKHHGGNTYLFAVNLRNQNAAGTFTLLKTRAGNDAEVLGEERHIPVQAGTFADGFRPYEVHLYRVGDGN